MRGGTFFLLPSRLREGLGEGLSPIAGPIFVDGPTPSPSPEGEGSR